MSKYRIFFCKKKNKKKERRKKRKACRRSYRQNLDAQTCDYNSTIAAFSQGLESDDANCSHLVLNVCLMTLTAGCNCV